MKAAPKRLLTPGSKRRGISVDEVQHATPIRRHAHSTRAALHIRIVGEIELDDLEVSIFPTPPGDGLDKPAFGFWKSYPGHREPTMLHGYAANLSEQFVPRPRPDNRLVGLA